MVTLGISVVIQALLSGGLSQTEQEVPESISEDTKLNTHVLVRFYDVRLYRGETVLS